MLKEYLNGLRFVFIFAGEPNDGCIGLGAVMALLHLRVHVVQRSLQLVPHLIARAGMCPQQREAAA